MIKRILILCLALLFLAGLLVPAAGKATPAGSIYYVSSSMGNDANNGLSQGAPFATVNKVNALALQPGDQVLFKCGDVWRADPLNLTRSGSPGQPITFSSYPAGCANQPRLSGAQPVSGWTAYSSNIYAADLGAGSNAGKFPHGVNQLFRQGARLTLGRWPNLDAGDGGYATIEGQPASNRITDNELPAGNWSGAVAHIKGMRWYILNRQVTASASHSLTVGSNLDCWGGDCTGWGYFINNHLNTLDQEGEWYYEPAANRLYLYTAQGIPADSQIDASVVLKTDDRFWGGILLGEDLGAEIAYVTIDNFALSGWFRDSIATPTNLAHYEIHDLVIRNNTISDVDATGIRLATWVYDPQDGRPAGWRGGYALTVQDNLIQRANRMGIDSYARQSTFSGNQIEDVGLIENLGAAGMGCAFDAGGGQCTEDGDGIRIKIDQAEDTGNNNLFNANRLERIAYNGVDVFGHHNTLQHNLIRQACFSKGDCGGVRTFGSDSLPGSSVHDLLFDQNLILDTIGNTDGCLAAYDAQFGFGLYIDNYSRDVTLTGNTVISSTVSGILFQNSTGVITGNTLYNNSRGAMYAAQISLTGSPTYISQHSGNILYSLSPTAWTLSAADSGRLGASDNNSFFNPYLPQHIQVQGSRSLAEWQSYSGKDAASKEAWFNLSPGEPPNSRIFYNDSAETVAIDLGSTLYLDLDQNPVYGSLLLPPYQSRVLVISGEAADLALSMAISASTAITPGAPLTYTLTVKNLGSAAASGVTLTHLLPAQIIQTGWTASAGGVTQQPGTRYAWDLPDLAAGVSLTLTVTGVYADPLPPGSALLLSAAVATSSPDTNPTNNQAWLRLGTWYPLYLPLIRR